MTPETMGLQEDIHINADRLTMQRSSMDPATGNELNTPKSCKTHTTQPQMSRNLPKQHVSSTFTHKAEDTADF